MFKAKSAEPSMQAKNITGRQKMSMRLCLLGKTGINSKRTTQADMMSSNSSTEKDTTRLGSNCMH